MNEHVEQLPGQGLAPAGLTIRRVRPADSADLHAFYNSLTAESRRARFLGSAAGVGSGLSRSFCTPDHLHAEGFVARLEGRGDEEGPLVGHLCLEPAGPRRIELALAVADEQQGRGIGRALMRAAVEWAIEHGLEAIVATAFADNGRVLRLLSSAPYSVPIHPADGGVVDVVVPLVADLPPHLSVPVGARRPRRRAGGGALRPRCRAVWRRRPQPARDVAG
jgi:GNAT superfamily N-acetyltransferase